MSFFLPSVRAIASQGSFQKLHVGLQVFLTRSPWNTLSPLESPPLVRQYFSFPSEGQKKKELSSEFLKYLFIPFGEWMTCSKFPTYL